MLIYVFMANHGLIEARNPIFFENFTSLRWRRKYYEPGEFELHAAPTAENISVLEVGAILRREDDPEGAEITGVTITHDDLTVTGRMLGFRMNEKLIMDERKSGSPTEIMRNYAKEIYNKVSDLSNTQPDKCEIAPRFKSYQEIISSLARFATVGYKVDFQGIGGQGGEDWEFILYSGADRSSEIIFSAAEGLITSATYTRDRSGYANVAVVAGAGEGYDRKVIRYTKPGIKDWERYTEIYVDARDIQREEGQSETDYENVLRQRGIEKLEEYLEAENFEADVVSDVYEYKKEWNLGDIVSVSHEAWGITESYRITEVEEVYEARSRKITPVFGTPLPELINLGGD